MDDAACHPGTGWGLAGALYLVLISPVAGPYSLVQASAGQAAVKSLLYAALGDVGDPSDRRCSNGVGGSSRCATTR